jgi:hypothetical protein
MTAASALPKNVVELIQHSANTEFSSLSGAGVPIDTPLLVFPAEDLSSIDVATGLAYPSKAERARRNPKVGLLIEGGPDEPVVSIAGMAAVRDRDIQANALHYISQTGAYSAGIAQPWEIAHKAVWYWSRIIIKCAPRRILWWDNPAAMDRPPHVWEAPADTVFPASDPAPPGSVSAAPKWPQPAWSDYAKTFLARNARGHLTLLDAEGFPLPFAARRITLTEDGFDLDMPAALPWTGPRLATLTFEGRATFVGQVTGTGSSTHLNVERILPVLPLVDKPGQVFLPEPDTKAALMSRLNEELGRRGLTLPVIPATKPEPTAGALRRKARSEALKAQAR